MICENAVTPKGGIGEHGFSAYVETERGNFLFDTGRGDALIHNLLAFDKDPLAIQKIFLSHGHQDHTGGLAAILGVLGGVDILAHPDIFFHTVQHLEKGRQRDPPVCRFEICPAVSGEFGGKVHPGKGVPGSQPGNVPDWGDPAAHPF